MASLKLGTESGECQIHLNGNLSNCLNLTSSRKSVIITDHNVAELHGSSFPDVSIIKIRNGEQYKTLSTIHFLYNQFMNLGVDRSFFIIAIGGGVLLDIAGFAATTFMRGVDFGFIPSTLLAMVDASIGGKNGVNINGFKNLAGTFNQPKFILYDLNLLKTLSEHEFNNGMAEVIKHAAIKSLAYIEFLKANAYEIKSKQPDTLTEMIKRSIKIKTEIVESDEKESGRRRLLNFGHTFGHAIEKTTLLSHGESVAVGMIMAAQLSHNLGRLEVTDLKRLKSLLRTFALPIKVDANKKAIFDAVTQDKKKIGENVAFILLTKLGEAVIQEIPYSVLKTAIEKWNSFL